ncbi:hypothetical protein BMR1_01G03240 [Babesia microti strain RI]|uniref:Uncharacterized protein n=1 Tax=Babesia microti (strain RI) TaxID=1133968 RepID=I7I8E0_BABMR|nr:hypothetical protein BMR1_01G03240 [Babesia microti strain RI]CCF73103.1 hypothetical protein BMR1_01G03240 [Babesia microti strain RI]|eukprot:XP_012647712.1 hypothetical protein BMR1_01G03240 [Babesia microti strain RI]
MRGNGDYDCRKALALWIRTDASNHGLDNFNTYNTPHSLVDCDMIFKSAGNIWPGIGEEILPNRINWYMCHRRRNMDTRNSIWNNSSNLRREVIQPVVASAMLEFSNEELEQIKMLLQGI